MVDTVEQMLKTIEQEASLTAAYTQRPQFSSKVMKAMSEVNRADFVPESARDYAYNNGPLSIGFGQTISQPYIVALMTDLLELSRTDQVLEVGTGSGYQTAILSQLAGKVFTVERVDSLAASAKKRLQSLGYKNIVYQQNNGYLGWPEHAPFDRIVVTAAAPFIPTALVEQLSSDGRLVLPLGEPYMYQELVVVTKDDNGQAKTQSILGVSFVPLVNDSSS